MNYLELFITAFIALRSNILRTALTMLGIIIGITSVILIISLAQGATSSITSQISALGSNLIFVVAGNFTPGQIPTSSTTLTYNDVVAVSKLPHAGAFSAVVQTSKQVVANGLNTNVNIFGVQEGYQVAQSVTMDKGTFISDDDVTSLSRVAVLGSEVAKNLFGENVDPKGQNIEIGNKFFRVIGVAASKGSTGFSNPDDAVYIPVTTAQTVLLGQTFLQGFQIEADAPEQVDTLKAEIIQVLMDRHKITDPKLVDFTIRTSKDALATLTAVTGILTAMLAGIGGISLLVGGIGIMNIMLVTVTERTKEIGLLKAIGAKRSDILLQFLIESVVLTLTGGVVGIVLGLSLSYLLSVFVLHVPFIFQISSVILSVGVCTVVGVGFGIYPAQRAAKLSPIDALRYE